MTSPSCLSICLESERGGGGGGGGRGGGGETASARRGQPPECGTGTVSVCMCGLPNDKFCMLNLKSVISSARRRQRPYTWVPMSICSV